jgi:hypothetical protein
MLYQPPAGVHQSLLQARQGPLLDSLRQRQPPPQVAQVVCAHVVIACFKINASIKSISVPRWDAELYIKDELNDRKLLAVRNLIEPALLDLCYSPKALTEVG